MFDMDGTLIDTHGLISEHMAAAFTGNGLPEPTPTDVRQIIGLSLPIAIARLSRSDDADFVGRLVDSYKSAYRDSLTHSVDREPLYPGARDALDRLRNAPATLLGIATGKGLAGVHRILGNHGLAGHFVTLQTPDHNPSKPAPGMLLRAMAETGASPNETIMIGDTVFDIELAVNAGCQAVGVTWGYHDPGDLLRAGAGAMIDSYDELDAAIARLLE
ncbi:MAG: HAD family hydrolase [Hyphomicrobiales bacterium]|nr:MAG: HAD family hydrolase [Hyphomicrobiales bacterium]